MSRFKKSPMYQSTTCPNQVPYQFQDFTAPSSTVNQSTTQPTSQIDSILVRKIQTIYKSQMLDIEQETEQHHQVESPKNRGQRSSRVILGDTPNTYNPFANITKLQSRFDTIKTRRQDDDDANENTKQSGPKLYQSKSSITIFQSQFTSDDLINIMPEPFRSNLSGLKQRVENRRNKIL